MKKAAQWILVIALIGACGDGIPSDRDYWHWECGPGKGGGDCGPGGLCLYNLHPDDARCFQECASNVECVEPGAECVPLDFWRQYCRPDYPVWDDVACYDDYTCAEDEKCVGAKRYQHPGKCQPR